jgi:XTP/dITP diphosphohydrolase
MELIFATNNKHKIEEVQAIIPSSFHIISLKEAGIDIDIEEPYETLEENAREKAQVIYKLKGSPCFSEDTGLEVIALNGEPGVHSARYAGEERSFSKNIDKVLDKLKDQLNRSAQFRAVICLFLHNKEYLFEGVSKGHIIKERRGGEGFGYDPVFIPEGATKTFAEMSLVEKSHYSHRRKAVDKLVTFLNSLD